MADRVASVAMEVTHRVVKMSSLLGHFTQVNICRKNIQGWLVVWNMNLCFHSVGIIIPTDELIFFRGVGIPPTRRSRIQGVRARSTDIAVQVVATAGSGESKLQFHVPIKV